MDALGFLLRNTLHSKNTFAGLEIGNVLVAISTTLLMALGSLPLSLPVLFSLAVFLIVLGIVGKYIDEVGDDNERLKLYEEHLKELLHRGLLTKILLAATLILLAMTVFNYQTVKLKNAQLEVMTIENLGARERVALEKQIGLMEKQVKLSNASRVSLSNKVKQIESQKNKYSDKIKEIEKDDKTKNLLDTRLPDDLKRLLDESIQTDGTKND